MLFRSRFKDSYILTADKLKNAKADMCILHPLPRVNEISVKVDSDSRACYFKQALYGKYMRMALILKLLKEAERDSSRENRFGGNVIFGEHKCKNPRCATAVEQELEQAVKLCDNGVLRCCYCDKEI